MDGVGLLIVGELRLGDAQRAADFDSCHTPTPDLGVDVLAGDFENGGDLADRVMLFVGHDSRSPIM